MDKYREILVDALRPRQRSVKARLLNYGAANMAHNYNLNALGMDPSDVFASSQELAAKEDVVVVTPKE